MDDDCNGGGPARDKHKEQDDSPRQDAPSSSIYKSVAPSRRFFPPTNL